MKRTSNTIISLILLAPAVLAQTELSTTTQQRLARLSALRAIESYETSATLFNDEAEENFRYLFNSDSAMVYNDLPGLAMGDSININEYIDLLKGQRGAYVSLSNIRGGELHDNGDIWLMPISFEKEIRYNTPCGAIISSGDYYGTPYQMEALIAVNKTDYEAYINSLHGRIDSRKPRLEPGFLLAVKTDPRDVNVRNRGRRLSFNKYDQAFVSEPVDLTYADDDMNMKVITSGTGDCRKFSFEYHPRRWRVTPHYDIAFGGTYSVDAAEGIEKSTSGTDFGVDFGYVLPSNSKLKIGLFTGVGLATSRITLDAPGIRYNYDAGSEADMDADTYVRYYELSDVAQTVKLSHLTIPIYAELDYRVHNRVSVFAQLGMKAYLNAGSKIERFSGESYSYGIYPQYGNLMMNESWLNDFGNTTLGLADIASPSIFKGFSADILAGIGVRVKIAGSLSADLALMFSVPAINRLTTAELPSLPAGKATAQNAPVQYIVAAGQQVSYTLLDYCKVKSNTMRLKIGLSYKF